MSGQDDEDDEVVREIDVFLCSSLSLQLLQFPLVPVYTPPMPIKAAKMKPKHRKMELLIGDYLDDPNIQTYCSSRVAQEACLAAGIISDNAMHISEIKNVLQMRTSYKKLQEGKGEMIEQMIDDDEKDNSEEEGEGLQQVQLKRKESERAQASRVNSFAYAVQQENQEDWIELEVHDIGSEESELCFDSMITSN
jgi:hypothetical protein